METRVYGYMERWKMAEPGMRVLTGFSGGADSVALLAMLQEYGQRQGFTGEALHVNHGIRGAEAKRDQAFCQAFCEARGIPCKVVYEDVPAYARREKISLEEAGRAVRYRVFSGEVAAGRADRVALAHHQNDQAETMLFHLMRGTGLRGLRGMEPIRLPYIRPLLCVSRQEIESWLGKRQMIWMEDSTNQELAYTRNQLRHQVIAPMEAIRPGSIGRMAGLAERLLELEDYLSGKLEHLKKQGVQKEGEGFSVSLKILKDLHPAMRKLLIHGCLESLLSGERDLKALHVDQVCRLLEGRSGSRLTLPGGCYAVLEYEKLLLKKGYGGEKSEEEVYCVPGGEYHYMGEIFCLTLENCEKIGEIPVNRYTKWFDYDKIKGNVVLRTRRPGDYLELSGGGHKKLKDYLIDCKIPREKRDRCILLADESHILWVAGMRISEGCKVTEGTKRVLKVQMRKSESPDGDQMDEVQKESSKPIYGTQRAAAEFEQEE